MNRKYTAFTKEFKLETIRLASQPDTVIAHLARDLGIRRNMIYKWRQQLDTKQSKAFKRTATGEDSEHRQLTVSELIKENNRLQKELKLATMENEILKKAQVNSTRQCNIISLFEFYGVQRWFIQNVVIFLSKKNRSYGNVGSQANR
ncbi:MAG: transposase [Pseudomonadota bacterium]|nr:transposase [Pseudomonadota bacterium]